MFPLPKCLLVESSDGLQAAIMHRTLAGGKNLCSLALLVVEHKASASLINRRNVC